MEEEKKDLEDRVLLVSGISKDVQEDFNRVIALVAEFPRDWMAIGMDAVDQLDTGYLSYMATYHPEDIPKALEKRIACGGNTDYKVISHEVRNGVDIVVPFEGNSGSSALLGVFAGLQMGYKKIILCGCPLQNEGVSGKEYEQYHKGWIVKYNTVMGKVKSMSGWTKDFLGEPTKEWLADKSEPTFMMEAKEKLERVSRRVNTILEEENAVIVPKVIMTPGGIHFAMEYQLKAPA
jgi:hypothetical protein